jgi:cytochrome b6-f complex iron-sulfur subunit
MNAHGLRRYIDDLLRGRRPKPFRPDDFEAAQIRTAIDLQAARLGSDAPRQEFLTDLRHRLAAQQDGTAQPAPKLGTTRRNVIVGTSAAAAAA